MTLPNFVIAGVKKASTTSLYYYLDQHPQIFMSPIKEPKFFAYDPRDPECVNADHNRFPVRTLSDYEMLYADANGAHALGEASPLYIDSQFALEQMAQLIPNVRLIFSLRQPVERAYSLYLMGIRDGVERRSFYEAVRNDLGRWQGFQYYQALKPWFERFGANQIRVVLFEDLKKDPVGITQSLYEFLGVDSTFVPDTSEKHNVGGVPKNMVLQRTVTSIRRSRLRKFIVDYVPQSWRSAYTHMHKRNLQKAPPMPADAAYLLQDLYSDDVRALETLLQRDLSIWKLS
ncbi:MAG: sulfotransferase [Caldilineaceae bacterium]